MKKSHLIGSTIGAQLPVIERGQGIYLYDEAGRRYIDGSSGAVTANIGHGNEEIVKAMAFQASQVAFVSRGQFTSGPAGRLAEKIAEKAPEGLENVFFVNSGSEAMETALKIAVQYWQERGYSQKSFIVTRKMSYHGNTLGALSMSGHTGRRERWNALLHDFPRVSPPYCYRCPFGKDSSSCSLECAEEFERVIREIGQDHVAAIAAEPIVGATGGALTPPDGYYQRVREICDRNQVLFIADEVMTGAGRTGTFLALEQWGTVPDIAALAKGLGAGYTPLAAVLVSDQIIEAIAEGSGSIINGHTYSGNPLSTAVGLAILEVVEKQDLMKNCRHAGEYLRRGLEHLMDRHPVVGDVRGKGLLLGLELVANRETKALFPNSGTATQHLIRHAKAHGLILYPASSGTNDAVLVAPPLIINLTQVDELLQLLDSALDDLERELPSLLQTA